MLFDPEQLTDRLRHVRWIGGGSGAGKSTIARQLAAEHGLHLYNSDGTIGGMSGG
jgi:shikimate kinase